LTQATPPARPPLARRPLSWLVLVAALLLIALAVAVGIAMGSAARSSTAAPSTSTPSDAPSAAPSTATDAPTASEPAAPPPASVIIPADCSGIYTHDWTADFHGLVLNPPWTQVPGNGPFWGSNNAGAVTVLEATTRLTCSWVGSSGGGDVGLITNIASLTSDQESSTIDHLVVEGYSCYEELEGTRCVIEWNSEAGNAGESHFLREGIWSATRWSEISPDGYTHDIVAAVFG
jgi:hypothetical protein